MDGETDELKKLNALLTHDHVGHLDLPSDECLTEARWIFEVEDEATIASVLIGIFASTEEGEALGPGWKENCRRTAARVMWVRLGKWF